MLDTANVKNILFIQPMDRVNFSKHKHDTLLMGYCVSDEEARDPKTKEKHFGDNGTGKLQSQQYCFPLQMSSIERGSNQLPNLVLYMSIQSIVLVMIGVHLKIRTI